MRDLLVPVGAGVEVDRIPHVLRDQLGHALHLPEAAALLLEAGHELRVGVVAHVRHHEIDEAVVVQVARVASHREIRHVRQALVDDIREGAVPVVHVEAVGRFEVVGDVEVGPAVLVGVEPQRGVALGQAPDAGLLRDVGEGPVAVVVEEVVPAPERALREIQDVGEQEAVEVAVAVVVGEGRLDARVLDVQAVLVRPLREGAVAVVDEEQVRRVEAADVEVGPAVLVDVDHRRAGDAARAVPGAVDPRRHGDVHELERGGLPVEGARAVARDDEDVQEPVAVEIRDGDAGLHGAQGQLAEPVGPHAGVVVEVALRHARLLGRKDLEGLRARRSRETGPERRRHVRGIGPGRQRHGADRGASEDCPEQPAGMRGRHLGFGRSAFA